jgi:Flp pilus assembly protein CpaB
MLAYLTANKAKEQKLIADFEAGKIKKINTVISKQKTLEVTNGAAQVRKVWTAIPVNEKLTPREFLIPDTSAIKEALKSGKAVAGWKWEQVDSIAV